jgi:YegS/Rv2252/BmrU family lipid kinase
MNETVLNADAPVDNVSSNTPAEVKTVKPVVIINPTAGKGRAGKIIDEIRDLFGDEGETWGWYTTVKPGHAEQIATAAAQLGAPVVIAVGGDGTVNEVVNGIYNSNSALGIIPAGLSNNLARALEIGDDLAAACKTIVEGDTITIDVGAIKGNKTGGGRAFLVQAGTGFNAWAAMRDGKGNVIGGALPTLTKFKPFTLSMTTEDGQTRKMEATFVSMVNAPTTAGSLRVAPRAAFTDGVLEVCVLGGVNQLQLMTLLPQLAKGKYVQHPSLKMSKTTMTEIDATPAQPLVIDGEVLGTTPATIWVVPNSLPVKVPRRGLGGL